MPTKACNVSNVNHFNLLPIEHCNDDTILDEDYVFSQTITREDLSKSPCPKGSIIKSPACHTNVTCDSDNCVGKSDNSKLSNLFTEIKQVKMHNPRNIIISHININSIRNKFQELKLLLELSLVQILIVSETKIDSTFRDALFYVKGYKMYRQDNTAKSGGLLIYVLDNIDTS